MGEYALNSDGKEWVIVKLGGSILTRSDGTVDQSVLERVGRDIGVHCGPAVVVHGTGSIGRAVLERHGVTTDLLPSSHREVISEFRKAVRDMNDTVLRVLESVGLQCYHLVPHEHFHAFSGRLVDGVPWRNVPQCADTSVVTVLHGDAVDDIDRGYYFCSGDEIVAALAARLSPVCVVFLTDVDGVYDQFPPEEGDLPMPSVDPAFATRMRAEYVVGQADMVGKVRQAVLAAEHANRCFIANGARDGLLARLLSNTPGDGDLFTHVLDSDLPSGVV